MTGLAVVVANRADRSADVVAGAAALGRELDDGDQLVWVDRAGLDPPLARPEVRTVRAPSGADRGTCYGLGLVAADRPFVAFTDSTTVIAPGWRTAAGRALEAGASVVGGPVMPSRPRSRLGWAGFVVDYGPHAVLPYTNAGGDVSGNNVAYHRHVLPSDARPLWKSDVDAGLRAAGTRPEVVAGMVVTVTHGYRWADLGRGRMAAAALYARQRSVAWSAPRRWVAAVGCAGLPLLALGRLWSRLRRDRELRGAFLASMPAILAALNAWGLGEAVGYLRPHGRPRGVW